MLISTIGGGKKGNGIVRNIISKGDWDDIVLIMDSYWNENFELNELPSTIKPIIACESEFNTSVESMMEKIKKELIIEKDADVHLLLGGGTSKLLTATLGALKQMEQSHKIVYLTREGVKTI